MSNITPTLDLPPKKVEWATLRTRRDIKDKLKQLAEQENTSQADLLALAINTLEGIILRNREAAQREANKPSPPAEPEEDTHPSKYMALINIPELSDCAGFGPSPKAAVDDLLADEGEHWLEDGDTVEIYLSIPHLERTAGGGRVYQNELGDKRLYVAGAHVEQRTISITTIVNY